MEISIVAWAAFSTFHVKSKYFISISLYSLITPLYTISIFIICTYSLLTQRSAVRGHKAKMGRTRINLFTRRVNGFPCRIKINSIDDWIRSEERERLHETTVCNFTALGGNPQTAPERITLALVRGMGSRMSYQVVLCAQPASHGPELHRPACLLRWFIGSVNSGMPHWPRSEWECFSL